uniref:VRR-NUC domain-containing protein n=1 Tax=viral metagenome TaxID=1070528 RepID=A0A6M3K5H3_9ZZZZ
MKKMICPKESSLKGDILKHFKGHPHVLIVPKHQDRFSNTTGVSDLLLCVCGCFVAIELKRDETKEATPKQKWFLSQVLRAGGYPAVCRSVEEVERIVNNIMHGLLKFPYEEVSNV